jgi:hypothetical protein
LGEWVDDVRSGFGEETNLTTGDFYRGNFLANEKCGKGFYLHQKEGLSYTGNFEAGEKNGCGKLEGDKFVYAGSWLNDKIHGMGFMKQDNRTYFGFFENGQRNGLGYECNQDFCYKGYWKNDKPHLCGVLKIFSKENPKKESSGTNLLGIRPEDINNFLHDLELSPDKFTENQENAGPPPIIPFRTGKKFVRKSYFNSSFLSETPNDPCSPSRIPSITIYNESETEPLTPDSSMSKSPQRIKSLKSPVRRNSIKNFEADRKGVFLGVYYDNGIIVETIEDKGKVEQILKNLDDFDLERFTDIVSKNINEISKSLTRSMGIITGWHTFALENLQADEIGLFAKMSEIDVKIENLEISTSKLVQYLTSVLSLDGIDIGQILEDIAEQNINLISDPNYIHLQNIGEDQTTFVEENYMRILDNLSPQKVSKDKDEVSRDFNKQVPDRTLSNAELELFKKIDD